MTSCPNCAETVSAGRFCANCGAALDAAAPDSPVLGTATANDPGERASSEAVGPEIARPWYARPGSWTAAAAFVLVAGVAVAMIVRADIEAFRGDRAPGATVAPTATDSHTLSGTFTLTDGAGSYRAGWTEGDPCSGSGGYADIRAGTQVVVTDGTGNVLAKSELGSGSGLKGEIQDMVLSCKFNFDVSSVPKSDFYKVSVGHRGELTYSYAEMQQNAWTVGFTLG